MFSYDYCTPSWLIFLVLAPRSPPRATLFLFFSLLKTQLLLNVFNTLRLEIAPRLSETEISTQNGPTHSSFYNQKLILVIFGDFLIFCSFASAFLFLCAGVVVRACPLFVIFSFSYVSSYFCAQAWCFLRWAVIAIPFIFCTHIYVDGGVILANVGPSLGPLWARLGHFGPTLGSLWADLGRLWAHFDF